MQRGPFITLEGGEGVGKSTQIDRLATRLRPLVGELVLTREPGGSPGAETLRSLLVRGPADRWTAVTETLLLYAAREDHLERLIRPALRRGAWVVSDRFCDSTHAYQGAGGGASAELIAELDAAVVGADRPDLTLILDLPIEVGLKRAEARGGEEQRFERKGEAFHGRLRAAFLDIARAEPQRCRVVAADRAPDQVAETIWSTVAERFGLQERTA